MLEALAIILLVFGVTFVLYSLVKKRRSMEFFYNNKFLLDAEIEVYVPSDMIYEGTIAQAKERRDNRIEVTIQNSEGTKEVVQVDRKDAKAFHYPLNDSRKYMGGMYFALIKEIIHHKSKYTTKVVGTDKSQIYLKNKSYNEPFRIHIDHVGYIDPNWSVGKMIVVEIKDRAFHITLAK